MGSNGAVVENEVMSEWREDARLSKRMSLRKLQRMTHDLLGKDIELVSFVNHGRRKWSLVEMKTRVRMYERDSSMKIVEDILFLAENLGGSDG